MLAIMLIYFNPLIYLSENVTLPPFSIYMGNNIHWTNYKCWFRKMYIGEGNNVHIDQAILLSWKSCSNSKVEYQSSIKKVIGNIWYG